jgi:hypothetical protein
MTPRPSVLVPVRVLEGESLPDGTPELLANAHVILLGYHVIPEQTAPGQARMQFADRATRKLEGLEATLREAGATVDRRLVFTHEAQTTINRMIIENDCLAVLVPNAVPEIQHVLVAVRGTIGVDRIARVVGGLFGETGVAVTLYHIVAQAETDEDVDLLFDALADRLAEFGLERDRIETRIDQNGTPVDAIAETAQDFDVVVMGETDPSIATFVFGMPADQVAETFLGPVLVVQREPPAEPES